MGIKQNLDEGFVEITQERYIEEMLQDFEMQDCNPRFQPLPLKLSYGIVDEKQDEEDTEELKQWRKKIPYSRLAGALLHLARYSRPDIQFAASYLARYSSNFNKQQWFEAKEILRYLKATKSTRLRFRRGAEMALFGYVDADWATDPRTRKSVSGYAFVLAGGCISWASRRQHSIATSTMEAEYMAMSEACQEAIYLRRMVEFLFSQCSVSPTLILCDNQGAICLSKNATSHRRSKHIDIRFHFNRQVQREGKVRFVKVASERNAADSLTKSLSASKVSVFRRQLGLVKEELSREFSNMTSPTIPWELTADSQSE